MSSKSNTFKNTIVGLTLAGVLSMSSMPVHGALGDRVLREGMRHKDVQELQQHLKDLGHFSYKETTTYFGTYTTKAVKSFQKSKGLAVDGSFGPQTSKTLLATIGKSSTPNRGNTSRNPEPSTSNGQTKLTYSRPLILGRSGQDVKDLQDALKKLGYLKIDKTTNYFGTMTKNAVMSFQRAHGLSPDGSFGPASFNKMNEILSEKTSSSSAPSRGEESNRSLTIRIVSTAKQLLGREIPYVYGGSSLSGFDCSGFTQYVYKQHGVNIPRSSVSQAATGTIISKTDLQAGDLLIFSNTYKSGPSHTGIYIGNGQFIHSSTSTKGIRLSSLNESYYSKHFSYGRRVY